jgi:2-polyprenyl-3-methyl-5-hydroxy-6-metoxy-1,4-benzoquinol methylase
LKSKLSIKDYSISGEEFKLLYNAELDLYATSPQPKLNELAKYYDSEVYISHTDAKKSFFDKIYQLVKNYTLSKKVKLIDSFNTKEKNILDIGCGTGEFLLTAKNKNWQVSGVEPNQKAKDLSKKKLGDEVVFNNLDDLILSDKKKYYDVISLWHVLEHIPNYEEYISKLKNLLKDEGVLIIAIPNFKSYDANYYKEFWAAWDVPRHLWHFSQKSILTIFEKEKMKIEKILPMKFDSFYVSLLSEKYKKGKADPFKAFWIGFLSNWKAKRKNEYSSLIYLIKNTK